MQHKDASLTPARACSAQLPYTAHPFLPRHCLGRRTAEVLVAERRILGWRLLRMPSECIGSTAWRWRAHLRRNPVSDDAVHGSRRLMVRAVPSRAELVVLYMGDVPLEALRPEGYHPGILLPCSKPHSVSLLPPPWPHRHAWLPLLLLKVHPAARRRMVRTISCPCVMICRCGAQICPAALAARRAGAHTHFSVLDMTSFSMQSGPCRASGVHSLRAAESRCRVPECESHVQEYK